MKHRKKKQKLESSITLGSACAPDIVISIFYMVDSIMTLLAFSTTCKFLRKLLEDILESCRRLPERNKETILKIKSRVPVYQLLAFAHKWDDTFKHSDLIEMSRKSRNIFSWCLPTEVSFDISKWAHHKLHKMHEMHIFAFEEDSSDEEVHTSCSDEDSSDTERLKTCSDVQLCLDSKLCKFDEQSKCLDMIVWNPMDFARLLCGICRLSEARIYDPATIIDKRLQMNAVEYAADFILDVCLKDHAPVRQNLLFCLADHQKLNHIKEIVLALRKCAATCDFWNFLLKPWTWQPISDEFRALIINLTNMNIPSDEVIKMMESNFLLRTLDYSKFSVHD